MVSIFTIKNHGPITVFKMGRSILGRTLYPVHSYLIGSLLVDTGARVAGRALAGALNDYCLDTIVNTHYHEDHTGNNWLFTTRPGIKILVHPGSLPYLADPGLIGMQLYRRITWGVPGPSLGTPIGRELKTESHTFQVIHTPGHTRDHICLYEPSKGWLFTGDLFCSEKVTHFTPEEDFAATMSSLAKVAALNVDTVFCSLRGIIPGGRRALERKMEYWDNLREQVLELRRRGFRPDQIRKELLGSEGTLNFVSRGHFSKQRLIDSILKTTSAENTL